MAEDNQLFTDRQGYWVGTKDHWEMVLAHLILGGYQNYRAETRDKNPKSFEEFIQRYLEDVLTPVSEEQAEYMRSLGVPGEYWEPATG